MKCFVKLTIIAGILLFIVSGVFGQQAVVQDITGTVEIKQKGGTVWEPVSKGQSISVDTTISTGFRSMAMIKLGSSMLTVRPLTRMTITEISSRTEIETINVSLQAGRVYADVKSPSGGAKTTSKIIMPVATASTRGTVFEVDVFRLWVIEGTVEFTGTSGAPVLVDAGRSSYINSKTGRPVPPEESFIDDLRPDLPLASELVNSAGRAAKKANNFETEAALDF